MDRKLSPRQGLLQSHIDQNASHLDEADEEMSPLQEALAGTEAIVEELKKKIQSCETRRKLALTKTSNDGEMRRLNDELARAQENVRISTLHVEQRRIQRLSFRSDPFGRNDFGRLRAELPQLGFAFAVYCIGVYTNSVTQAYLQKHSDWFTYGGGCKVLWDFGYHFFPHFQINQDWGSILWIPLQFNLADFMAGSTAIGVLVRFIVVPGPLSMRWTILRRLLFLSGIMFFLRAFSIVSTVLPNPDHTCKCTLDGHECTKDELENIYWFAWQVFVMKGVTCMDVLFSGHTVALTASLIVDLEYSHKAPWFTDELSQKRSWCIGTNSIKALVICYALWGYLCIIASRFHYTADVMMGFLLTVLVFKGYHHAIHVADMSGTIPLAVWNPRSWIQWFEQTALDVRVWHTLAKDRLRVEAEATIEIQRRSCGLTPRTLSGANLSGSLSLGRYSCPELPGRGGFT